MPSADEPTIADEPTRKPGTLAWLRRRRAVPLALVEVIIVFLALIRTLTSYYQLRTQPGNMVPAGQVEPIITGSLVAALFCLVLVLLSALRTHRLTHAVFALAIVSLVLVKTFLFSG